MEEESKASPKIYEHSKGGVNIVSPHETYTKGIPTRYNKHKYSNVLLDYGKNGHVN